nr:MAG TPA: hypothetical protein [Caudoviricetes sp.]
MSVMMEHIVQVAPVDRHILQHILKNQHTKRRLQAILQNIHLLNKIFNQIQYLLK